MFHVLVIFFTKIINRRSDSCSACLITPKSTSITIFWPFLKISMFAHHTNVSRIFWYEKFSKIKKRRFLPSGARRDGSNGVSNGARRPSQRSVGFVTGLVEDTLISDAEDHRCLAYSVKHQRLREREAPAPLSLGRQMRIEKEKG